MKNILHGLGFDLNALAECLGKRSIRAALIENRLDSTVDTLRKIVPDISRQESGESGRFNDYVELKRRGLQAFQVALLLRALETLPAGKLTVVDIGDSAGTHMLYLKALTQGRFDLDTVSVNLDPRAIEKIRGRGLTAVLCRAEELDLGDRKIDLFTSFEMVEHLHDPAIFFRRLARKSKGNRMVMTVPFLRRSRVGLHHVRRRDLQPIFAEDEHIFELAPEDWTLLLLHSGWKVAYSRTYYQYPRRVPAIGWLLGAFWRKWDFEGFWGAILEKDTRFSDCYQNWGD